MNLTDRKAGGVRIVSVRGRIDQAGTADFQRDLAPFLDACRAGAEALVLDLAAVDYVSSVGLRALMLAARQVQAQAGHLAVAALSPLVAEVFQISRFDLVLRVFDTVDAAIAGVSAA